MPARDPDRPRIPNVLRWCAAFALTWVVATSCSATGDSDPGLIGLSREEVIALWGQPEVVGYMDGKLFEVVRDPSNTPADFEGRRVAFDRPEPTPNKGCCFNSRLASVSDARSRG